MAENPAVRKIKKTRADPLQDELKTTKDETSSKRKVTSQQNAVATKLNLAQQPSNKSQEHNQALESKDNVAPNNPKVVWANPNIQIAYDFNNIEKLSKKLKSFHYGAVFKSQLSDRRNHRLVKGTFAALGTPGAGIAELCKLLNINVTESEGETIVPNNSLISAFANEGINQNWQAPNPAGKDSVRTLSSLVSNLTSYEELGLHLDQTDEAFIFVRFHQIKFIQRHIFQSELHSYLSQSRIGSDHKDDVTKKLINFLGTSIAVSSFLELVDKMIEAYVLARKALSREKVNELLFCHRSSFISIRKSYEKALPAVQVRVLPEKKRQQLARQGRSPSNNDYITENRVKRPLLHTVGFLTVEEKAVLAGFNRKLNEFSSHLPDIQTADGSARRAHVLSVLNTNSIAISHVNKVVKSRKSKIYNGIVRFYKHSHHDWNDDQIKKAITKEDWKAQFESGSGDDLSEALAFSFGCCDSKDFDVTAYVHRLTSEPMKVNPKENLTSSDKEEVDDNNADMD